jgi:hypothetical protein
MINLKSLLIEANDREVVLYHLTWKSNVDSILSHGLIPNRIPNDWVMKAAKDRSNRGNFLCTKKRKPQWEDVYHGGWVRKPSKNDHLVWLRVSVPLSWIVADHSEGENYGGDFICNKTIPPNKIRMDV